MKALIENYRGFEVYFEPDNERFTYCIDDSSWKTKQSYATCKKSIDDYLKTNAHFKAVLIRNINSGTVYRLVGMRKDNRFIIESQDGSKKEQLSTYDEKNYIVFNPEHDMAYKEIEDITQKIRTLNGEERKIRETITGKTVFEIRKLYTQNPQEQ